MAGRFLASILVGLVLSLLVGRTPMRRLAGPPGAARRGRVIVIASVIVGVQMWVLAGMPPDPPDVLLLIGLPALALVLTGAVAMRAQADADARRAAESASVNDR